MIALLPNCGFLSETSRMLAIARALEARGVRTAIASHGGPYAHLLEEAGCQWTHLQPAVGNRDAAAFVDNIIALRRPLYTDAFMRTAVRSEADFFGRSSARMAVIGFNLTTYISSRVAAFPLATSHGGSFMPPVLERGLCPVPINPYDPRMARLPRFVQRWLANRVPQWINGPARDLKRMAHEFGVEQLPSFMAMMCGDLTLVTEIPEVLGISRRELESWRPRSRRYWPTTRLRYVGPLYAKLGRPLSDRVRRFLARDRPVILVSPTSVNEPFLRALVPAVQAAGASVLVSSTIHDLGDMENDRVMVESILPNHLVMPEVDAAVLMGGQGSVQTAMAAGTPFIGMPFHGEQELNVALAERQGMAIRFCPADAGTPAMTRAVRRLIEQPAFKENAARARQCYRGADGAEGAADAIVAFLQERA